MIRKFRMAHIIWQFFYIFPSFICREMQNLGMNLVSLGYGILEILNSAGREKARVLITS
jgi:hypothetical protein